PIRRRSCSGVSTRSTGSTAGPIRTAPTTAGSASSWIESEEIGSMTRVNALAKCGGKLGRLAAVAGLAATLAGCYTAPQSVAAVPPQGIAVRPYRPADPGRLATIKLVYPRITAEAGPCGLWPNDLGPSDFSAWDSNKPYWNLGCATQRNLAAMVVNPTDVAQP